MSRRVFAFILMVFSLAFTAQATPADPHVIFDTAVNGLPTTPVDAFNFHANPQGGGVFNFRNLTGNDWVAVDLLVTLPGGRPLTCLTLAFYRTCDFTSTPSTTMPGMADYDIRFHEPKTNGVTNGTVFSLNLNNLVNGKPDLKPNGSGGWGSNALVDAATTVTPEPASFLLLGCGVVLIGAMRRLRGVYKS